MVIKVIKSVRRGPSRDIWRDLTLCLFLLHCIRRRSRLASRRPVSRQNLGVYILKRERMEGYWHTPATTHVIKPNSTRLAGHSTKRNKYNVKRERLCTQRGTNDFAMARILVSAALKADGEDGQEDHDDLNQSSRQAGRQASRQSKSLLEWN